MVTQRGKIACTVYKTIELKCSKYLRFLETCADSFRIYIMPSSFAMRENTYCTVNITKLLLLIYNTTLRHDSRTESARALSTAAQIQLGGKGGYCFCSLAPYPPPPPPLIPFSPLPQSTTTN